MSAEGEVNGAFRRDGDQDPAPEADRQAASSDVTTGQVTIEVECEDPAKMAAKMAAGREGKKYTAEEEQILEVLREVVRKCTNMDPVKRPTATEVLGMLNKCPVK